MSSNESNKNNTRRRFIKTLITIPLLGGLTFFGAKEFLYLRKKIKHSRALKLLGFKTEKTSSPIQLAQVESKKHLRIGLIGAGFRGKQQLQACGFASEKWMKENDGNLRLESFKNQADLNLSLSAICDVFDLHAEQGLEMAMNPLFDSGRKVPVKRYKTYQDLIDSSEVDGVIIATPDHWHAPITLYAARAGKHVYCEKCMTRTADEAIEVYNTIRKSNIVFQLGHQNRQHKSIIKAHDIYKQGILGNISSIETFTNRNTLNEAWVRHTGKPGDEQSIDWQLFNGPNNNINFDIERFYNWTLYWDYGTGLAGQLLSHEYDIINQILELGIPESATATGGIYHHIDGRQVPDVFNVILNYPKRGLTMTYNATLSNSTMRNAKILGSDATLVLGQEPQIRLDRNTKKHKELIEKELLDPATDIISFNPTSDDVDAITSATQKHYAARGLTYTEYEGGIVDATHLHIHDWLLSIRNGEQPKCNINRGLEEAITCHMATMAYKEQRMVHWDANNMQIV